jgi:hypothetical protein
MARKRGHYNKGQNKPDPTPQKRIKVQASVPEALPCLVLKMRFLKALDEY